METINSLMASLRLQDIRVPGADDIRDLIVDASVAIEIGADDTVSVDAVTHLCRAHTATLEEAAELNGCKYLFLQGEEAEARYHEAALRAYRAEFPDEPNDSERVPTWPAGFPTKEPLSVSLLDYTGYLLGYRSALYNKRFLDYCLRAGSAIV